MGARWTKTHSKEEQSEQGQILGPESDYDAIYKCMKLST